MSACSGIIAKRRKSAVGRNQNQGNAMKPRQNTTGDIPTQIKDPQLVERRRQQIVDAAVLFWSRLPVFGLATTPLFTS
jgi:hypothetical protein